jgi:hypothetical protein
MCETIPYACQISSEGDVLPCALHTFREASILALTPSVLISMKERKRTKQYTAAC